ncbi:NAD(P)/FAD-dependent oxidoreductase [Nocardia sp. NPDC051929]|uniref:NAD(P)/FAD-dependent oxidoreductase n=1 Tax=Nocardia sp. NPDC051929 TaxID=3364327 RepID=UPI0037C6EEEE
MEENMQRAHVDIAVVGGGLIGASSALHLQAAGLSVAIVDSAHEFRASNAAAGMLTPACEFDDWMPSAFWELLTEGLEYYKPFLERFGLDHDATGYRDSVFTLLQMRETGVDLRPRLDMLRSLKVRSDWLDGDDVTSVEPNLSPGAYTGAIRIHDQGVVNPLLLHDEVMKRFVSDGGRVISSPVVDFGERGDDVLVSTADGLVVTAAKVVLAAGPWTAQVAALAGHQLPDYTPVKGQMVELSGPARLTNSVVFMPAGGCGSIVERAPGQYIVGTSEEYVTPSVANTAGVVGAILTRLRRVLPAAGEWSIERMWTGFRPMLTDELPAIGEIGGGEFIVAAGHHRNGVLLAPFTGKLVADLIAGTRDWDLSPYRPDRPQRRHARFAGKY